MSRLSSTIIQLSPKKQLSGVFQERFAQNVGGFLLRILDQVGMYVQRR